MPQGAPAQDKLYCFADSLAAFACLASICKVALSWAHYPSCFEEGSHDEVQRMPAVVLHFLPHYNQQLTNLNCRLVIEHGATALETESKQLDCNANQYSKVGRVQEIHMCGTLSSLPDRPSATVADAAMG